MVDQASQLLPLVKQIADKVDVMAEKQVQKEDVKELREELRDLLLRQKQVGAGMLEWGQVSGRAARGGQPAMIVIMFFTHRVKVFFGMSDGLLDAALIYTRPHSSLISQEADDRDIRFQKLVMESALFNATQVNDLREERYPREERRLSFLSGRR